MSRLLPLCAALVLACRGDTPPEVEARPGPGETTVESPPPSSTRLAPVDRLVRASMTLRGLRPSAADVTAVVDDPSALADIVERYLADPAFGEVIRDMHHEQLLMRSEDVELPALGPLTGTPVPEIHRAIVEEPLALVEEIVTSGEPYSAVVTADYTMADPTSAQLWGHADYSPRGGEGWQRVSMADDRPAAGILSSTGLWVRHPSNGRNHHRARAAMVSRTLLCYDFLAADVPIDGSVDLTDDAAVADALNTNPGCVACHENLDPLASALFGLRETLNSREVAYAYEVGCASERRGAAACYPIALFTPERANTWERLGMRAPGLFGEPVADLGELGQAIADHPQFPACTVRRFFGWFAQVPPADVDAEVLDDHLAAFEKGGLDARQLAKDLVLSDRFMDDAAVGLLTVRPEQYARLIEQLTGFRWQQQIARGGEIYDLARTDRYGFRSMSGGLDGIVVTEPTHQMTPVKALTVSTMATEAAAWVVREDLSGRLPRLLRVPGVATTATDEVVRQQLVELYLDVLSLPVQASSPEVDAAAALFFDTYEASGDLPGAWTLTLSALLQDPRLMHY